MPGAWPPGTSTFAYEREAGAGPLVPWAWVSFPGNWAGEPCARGEEDCTGARERLCPPGRLSCELSL